MPTNLDLFLFCSVVGFLLSFAVRIILRLVGSGGACRCSSSRT
jgi:hypothetical protein